MSDKINIIFFGTPDYSLVTLKALFEKEDVCVCGVVTKQDKESGRGQKIVPSPVKAFCIENNIPCFQPKSLKKETQDFFDFCKNFPKIDFNIVIAYGQILPKEVLDFPKFGSINLHASLLPTLRGAAPIQRAIMLGLEETGVSLMKMDEGLDTGDVYLMEETKISDTTTFLTLHDELATLSAKIIVENIEKIKEQKLIATKQENTGATYADKIRKEEAHIDWNKPTKEILRLINAMDPVLGAFSMIDQKRIKLFCPEIVNEDKKDSLKTPGEILKVEKNGIVIKTKDSALKINEVQLEGKKRLKIQDFLTGYKLKEGKIFS